MMLVQSVLILDHDRTEVATALVEFNGESFSGSIDLSRTPQDVLLLFEEFETTVNQQSLSLLDDLEDRIVARDFVVRLPDGRERPVENLQVYPREASLMFRLVAVASEPVGTPPKISA